MPAVPFPSLPDDARLWVFAADRPLAGDAERALLDAADRFLAGWAAHGAPLRAARDWRDAHFLAVAVDQRTEGASGCSIDGLFRSLRALEPEIGATLRETRMRQRIDPTNLVKCTDRGSATPIGCRAARRSAAGRQEYGPCLTTS